MRKGVKRIVDKSHPFFRRNGWLSRDYGW